MFRKIVVVGLGYVGIPVACEFADHGFDVVGIDSYRWKVDWINEGKSPIKGKEPFLSEMLKKAVSNKKLKATQDFAACKDADAVFVCVQTPFDFKKNEPDSTALKSAVESIGKNLNKGSLIVIESTIAPTTMDKIVKPILEDTSNLKAGEDFYLANCPERVMPGRLIYNLEHLDRIVGGINEKSAKKAVELYKHIVKGDLYPTDSLTAEIVKTTENAYRDVQIAFANEIALICEELGADVFKVRRLVNKCPGREMLVPGAGVGGHCLPKDSWLLAWSVKDKIKPKILSIAREINDHMPHHLAELVEDAFKGAGKMMKGARITVLGIAYLQNSDDVRNSPAIPLILDLEEKGAEVMTHDPYVSTYPKIKITNKIDDALADADCLVVVTAHDDYKELKLDHLKKVMRSLMIVDGRNLFNKKECQEKGFMYKGIGK